VESSNHEERSRKYARQFKSDRSLWLRYESIAPRISIIKRTLVNRADASLSSSVSHSPFYRGIYSNAALELRKGFEGCHA
jgi:hypothetical protein